MSAGSVGVTDFVAEFERAEARLRERSAAWLEPLRRGAISSFRDHGFPGRRNEEWLYTRIASVTRARPRTVLEPGPVADDAVARLALPADDGVRLVFVDGLLDPARSRLEDLPAGVRTGSLADLGRDAGRDTGLAAVVESHFGQPLLGEQRAVAAGKPATTRPGDDAFACLNTACFADGALVYLEPGVQVDRPIHLVYLSSGTVAGGSGDGRNGDGRSGDAARAVTYPRNLFVACEGSRGTIIETYAAAGGNGYLTDAVTEVVVESGAHLEHYKLEREAADALHIARQRARVAGGARYATWFLSFGAALVRNEIFFSLDGEDSETALNGIYVADGERQVDIHTVIHHVAPGCFSRERYKGVLSGRSRGAFSGKIHVHQDAQKTNAEQANDSLLLSADAVSHSRPRLEIYADDVRCTHGATIGELDDDALFYLRSRGIPHSQARHMLVRAFVADLLSALPNEALREHVETLFAEHLPVEEDT